LPGSDFSGSLLTGASFTKSDLSKADFRTAKDYFIDPSFTKIKGAKFALPEALALLTALGAEVDY
jgi:fluoroquinolone resistance protein